MEVEGALPAAVDGAMRAMAVPPPAGTTEDMDDAFEEMGAVGMFPARAIMPLPLLLAHDLSMTSRERLYLLLSAGTAIPIKRWRVLEVDEIGRTALRTVGQLDVLHNGNFFALVTALITRPNRRLVWCRWATCSPFNLFGWTRFPKDSTCVGVPVAADAAVPEATVALLRDNVMAVRDWLPRIGLPEQQFRLPWVPINDYTTIQAMLRMARRTGAPDVAAWIEDTRRKKIEKAAAAADPEAAAMIRTRFVGPPPPGLNDIVPRDDDFERPTEEYTLKAVQARGMTSESARIFLRQYPAHAARGDCGMFKILTIALTDAVDGNDAAGCMIEGAPTMVWLNRALVRAVPSTLEGLLTRVNKTKMPVRHRRLTAALKLARANRDAIAAYESNAYNTRPPSPGALTESEVVAYTSHIPVTDSNPEIAELEHEKKLANEAFVEEAMRRIVAKRGYTGSLPSATDAEVVRTAQAIRRENNDYAKLLERIGEARENHEAAAADAPP